jgi:hypothetical protein
MAILFSDLLAKGVRQGKIPAKEQDARTWYRNTARKYSSVTEASLRKDKTRLKSKIEVGSMYMFSYDAKTKASLPYFDRFPLIFPFRAAKSGFYGINLHYLPPTLRAKLMDNLYDVASNKKFDESTRLRLNYSLLSSASKFSGFKACVKQYLNSQVKSRFIYVYPAEWDIALFLPTENFAGASKSKVWADSRKMIT